jgi:hypothetical protein
MVEPHCGSVEGAEEEVLETVDPACFGVVLVEMDETNRARDRRVHARLEAAGLLFQRQLATHHSGVYLRPKKARWRLKRSPPGADGGTDTATDQRMERCGERILPYAEYEFEGKRYTGLALVDLWQERRAAERAARAPRGGGRGGGKARLHKAAARRTAAARVGMNGS